MSGHTPLPPDAIDLPLDPQLSALDNAEHYYERARRLGAEIRREMESWNLPVVQGVRGLGLLLGIGLNPEMVAAPEGKTIASVVVEALRQEGLLSVPAGPETVRLLPPLNVSEEEIQQALAIIRRVLKTYAK